MFATTELEVEDILSKPEANWAEQLRDRLGLGHLNPTKEPINVLLLNNSEKLYCSYD